MNEIPGEQSAGSAVPRSGTSPGATATNEQEPRQIGWLTLYPKPNGPGFWQRAKLRLPFGYNISVRRRVP